LPKHDHSNSKKHGLPKQDHSNSKKKRERIDTTPSTPTPNKKKNYRRLEDFPHSRPATNKDNVPIVPSRTFQKDKSTQCPTPPPPPPRQQQTKTVRNGHPAPSRPTKLLMTNPGIPESFHHEKKKQNKNVTHQTIKQNMCMGAIP
jgi:hypothetical protein